jgi:hypothetical protein
MKDPILEISQTEGYRHPWGKISKKKKGQGKQDAVNKWKRVDMGKYIMQ